MALKKIALKFIILLGIVSLFADVTYEGARSIVGPFFSTLGASGAIVGSIVALSELAGYGVRGISGYVSDRTGRYWVVTFIGYGLNLLTVPLLALAGNWQIAAILVILERIGKAIRVPARDAMLSYAGKHTGRGWGFGIHEALDRVGAFCGPFAITLLLYFNQTYRLGFAFLAIPAFFALIALVRAYRFFPSPRDLEPQMTSIETKKFSRKFWTYIWAVCLLAAGFTDFILIAFHFQKAMVVQAAWIPLFYAVAMALAGVATLAMGRLFDKVGIVILAWTAGIGSIFAPLVFLGGFYWALIGMILWGLSLGAQNSVMRAMVATLVPPEKRGSAYGMFNMMYGIARAGGSALMGLFYDFSITYIVIFSILTQLASIPLFVLLKRKIRD